MSRKSLGLGCNRHVSWDGLQVTGAEDFGQVDGLQVATKSLFDLFSNAKADESVYSPVMQASLPSSATQCHQFVTGTRRPASMCNIKLADKASLHRLSCNQLLSQHSCFHATCRMLVAEAAHLAMPKLCRAAASCSFL